MLAINFYPMNSDEILQNTKQDCYWPRSSHFNYFEEPYIPPLREELYVEQHIFLEENIEVYEEVHKDLIIEEPKIKIVKDINEDPIVEKDHEVKIVEIIKE